MALKLVPVVGEDSFGAAALMEEPINIFLAVTSSGSIGGWVIWDKYSFLWAFIIAASQVINVVKQFLPYKTRVKTTGGILKELPFDEIASSFVFAMTVKTIFLL